MPYQILQNKMQLTHITHNFLNGDGTEGLEMSIKKEVHIFDQLLPKGHIVTRNKSYRIKIRVNDAEGASCMRLKFKAMLKLRTLFILCQDQKFVHILGCMDKILNQKLI